MYFETIKKQASISETDSFKCMHTALTTGLLLISLSFLHIQWLKNKPFGRNGFLVDLQLFLECSNTFLFLINPVRESCTSREIVNQINITDL